MNEEHEIWHGPLNAQNAYSKKSTQPTMADVYIFCAFANTAYCHSYRVLDGQNGKAHFGIE